MIRQTVRFRETIALENHRFWVLDLEKADSCCGLKPLCIRLNTSRVYLRPKNYQLQKLLSGYDSNISAITWDPTNENNLAQASVDKKFLIWDLETEKVKFEVQLTSHIVHIEWNRHNAN